ncbi:MAG TPA: hypothetical protein VGN17_04910 [Bryobacteraceae bacterium]|jgi:hypothetical protein
MKKFELMTIEHPAKRGSSASDKTAVLVYWTLANQADEFDAFDIMTFAWSLGLDTTQFDSTYRGADYAKFATNEKYDLSLFFADKANEVFLSVICHSKEAKKQLDGALHNLQQVKEGERFHKQ